MEITHDGAEPGSSVIHDGVEYVASDRASFDVPQAVANDLLKFPNWHHFVEKVETFDAGTEADLRSLVLAAHQRIDELENEVKKLVGELKKVKPSAAAKRGSKAAADAADPDGD